MFKTTILAAAFAATTTLSAYAGGMSEPVMEPQIVVQEVVETSNGSNGLLQWLIIAGIIVAATAN